MPKIKKKKIEQCTKIFIYRDLKDSLKTLHMVSRCRNTMNAEANDFKQLLHEHALDMRW